MEKIYLFDKKFYLLVHLLKDLLNGLIDICISPMKDLKDLRNINSPFKQPKIKPKTNQKDH